MRTLISGCEVFIKKAYMWNTEFLVVVPHLERSEADARNQLVIEQREFIERAIREKIAAVEKQVQP